MIGASGSRSSARVCHGGLAAGECDRAARPGDELPDDGQSEPGAARAAPRASSSRVKRSNTRSRSAWRDAWAVVADTDHGLIMINSGHRDLDPGIAAWRTALSTRFAIARRSSSASAMIITGSLGMHRHRNSRIARKPRPSRPQDHRRIDTAQLGRRPGVGVGAARAATESSTSR